MFTERRLRGWLGILVACALILGGPCLAEDRDSLPPPVVSHVKPFPALSNLFVQQNGWTGADGAYSIALDSGRTLWLFGDTWIGRISGGRRLDSAMTNNSAAWQSLPPLSSPLKFFWLTDRGKPLSLLAPDRPDAWYWPGDGVVMDGRLYLFCMVVERRPNKKPPFEFEVIARELLKIENPFDDPRQWRSKKVALPADARGIQLGVSCLLLDQFLYVYGSLERSTESAGKHPIVLARIDKQRLANMDMTGWQYWCTVPEARSADQGQWLSEPAKPAVVFPDGAPEMTVCPLKGSHSLIACYTAFGLSDEIRLRQALRPEGPWSRPTVAYRCPEAGKKVLTYSAKAHPELSNREGELVITYCRNLAGTIDEHFRHPHVYRPRAIIIRLQEPAPETANGS